MLVLWGGRRGDIQVGSVEDRRREMWWPTIRAIRRIGVAAQLAGESMARFVVAFHVSSPASTSQKERD